MSDPQDCLTPSVKLEDAYARFDELALRLIDRQRACLHHLQRLERVSKEAKASMDSSHLSREGALLLLELMVDACDEAVRSLKEVQR